MDKIAKFFSYLGPIPTTVLVKQLTKCLLQFEENYTNWLNIFQECSVGGTLFLIWLKLNWKIADGKLIMYG